MTTSLNDEEIKKTAKKILVKYQLCDHCLGRIFAKIESGKTNQRRGEILRDHLDRTKKTEIKNCWLCEGLTSEIPHFTDLIMETLNDYEFESFLVGCKVDEDILGREQELFDYAGSEYSESIKTEINRETGKILEEKLGKEVDFENPTIMTVVDTAFDVVSLQIVPLFVYGRYKKFKRDIPQTRWFCRICRGKGCKKCDYTGQMYETSVEQLVSKRFLEATYSKDESFHGAGREDIDVLMLGTGRPFVLEIKNPHVRNIDLSKIETEINKDNKDIIEICNLRFSDRKEIARIKNSKFKKIYHVTFQCEKPINSEKLKKAVLSLRDAKIGQFTPSRVAHRRADMLREKYIYNCKVDQVDGAMATLTLETESGTYIKELVSGDNGRTKPSISEMIGVPCKVTELDVIEIKGE